MAATCATNTLGEEENSSTLFQEVWTEAAYVENGTLRERGIILSVAQAPLHYISSVVQTHSVLFHLGDQGFSGTDDLGYHNTGWWLGKRGLGFCTL